MTRPTYSNLDLTPTQVSLELLKLGRELDRASNDLEQFEEEAVKLSDAYATAKEQAVLRANEEPSLTAGDTRKAWAFVRTQPERIAAHVAEAKGRARKQLIDTLKTRVTIGQSVATAPRSELDLEALRSR